MARHVMRGDLGRTRSILKIAVLLVGVMTVGFVSYSYWLVNDTLSSMTSDTGGGSVEGGAGSETRKDMEAKIPRTILVLGTDARRKQKEPARTDTMFLMRVDPKTRRAALLSIPRDTWVDIPGHGEAKINSAYALGKGPLSVRTVENFTDVDIDSYVVVDWRAFRQFVDAIGPVKAYIPKTIDDPIHSYRMEQGCQELNGYEALQYVRFRNDKRGDIGRIERQQAFMRAVSKQAIDFRNITKIPRIMNIIGDNVITDMTKGDVWGTANLVRKIPRDDIQMMMVPGNLDRRRGQSVILPDEEGMREVIDMLMATSEPRIEKKSSSAPLPGESMAYAETDGEPDFPGVTTTTLEPDCD